MNNSARISTLLMLLILVSYSLIAQISSITQVSSLQQKPAGNGIYYALPETAIEVTMTVKKTAYFKGPYAYFAEELMGLTDFVVSDHNDFEIITSEISTSVHPDPNRTYFVQLAPPSTKERKAIQFSITESGIITGMNQSTGSSENKQTINESTLSYIHPELFELGKSGTIRQTIDTVIRIITSDTNVFKKVHFETVFEVVSDKEKAKFIVEEINRIRESQNSLLSGYQEIAYNPETLKYMIETLNKLVEEYISLFRGTKVVSYETHTFSVTPPANEPSFTTDVCRFSAEHGMMPVASAKGKTVQVNFAPLGSANKIEAFTSGENNSQSLGLFYTIPERSEISLNYYGQVIKKSTTFISQFGETVQLPDNINHVIFDENTGMVKSVSVK